MYQVIFTAITGVGDRGIHLMLDIHGHRIVENPIGALSSWPSHRVTRDVLPDGTET